jgi:hypothetical protein
MRFSVKLVGALFAAIIILAVLVSMVAKRGDLAVPDYAPLQAPAKLPGSAESIEPGLELNRPAASKSPDLKATIEPVHPSLERFGVPMSAEAPPREASGAGGASTGPDTPEAASLGRNPSGQTAQNPQGPGAMSPGPAGEAGPISEPFNIDDPGLPPETPDPIVSGPPPEASDPGIDYPAPEAGDPGISYPSPEASDPGIDYPAPEDSLPDPAAPPSGQNP